MAGTGTSGRRRRAGLLPYLLVGPAIVLELVVHIAPTLLGVWTSLTRLNQSSIGDWTAAPFAGLRNYREGLDPNGPIGAQLWASVLRTVVFTGLVVTLAWAVGMLAAYLLNSEFRGRGLFRAFFLVPFALPAFVSIVGWSFMFGRDNGAVNRLLVDDLGVVEDRPFWLIGGNAFWVVVVVAVWKLWPFAFLMLLAALQNVPDDVDEAGALDGASSWQRFRRITLPMIRPVNAVVVLVMGLWSFNEFTVPYVLFGPQPPESAALMSTLVYDNAFVGFDLGLAAAMNVLVVGVLLGAMFLYVRLIRPSGRRHA